MDRRGGVGTAVKAGASCASACAMALFVSGTTRVVYMGGRLGIHSCRNSDGSRLTNATKRWPQTPQLTACHGALSRALATTQSHPA
jgi:hypothetical protein